MSPVEKDREPQTLRTFVFILNLSQRKSTKECGGESPEQTKVCDFRNRKRTNESCECHSECSVKGGRLGGFET